MQGGVDLSESIDGDDGDDGEGGGEHQLRIRRPRKTEIQNSRYNNQTTNKRTKNGGSNQPTRKAVLQRQSADKEASTKGGGDNKRKNTKGENQTTSLADSADVLLGPST